MLEMSASFDWDSSRLDEAIRELRDRLGDRILEAGERALEYAKEMSPVDTSNNKKALTMDYFEDGSLVKSVGEFGSDSGSVATAVAVEHGFFVYGQSGYSGWLELGTSKTAAQPHIVPGFDRAVRELLGDLEGFAN